MAGARIESPDILKEFKVRFIRFEETARQAVSAAQADAHRTLQWLRSDQMHHWKRELQKADDKIAQAKSEYLLARYGSSPAKKTSYFDELKILRRAEQRKQDVQRKIDVLKKWAGVLEQQAEKMLGPVSALTLQLDVEAPKAKARLEAMILSLEEYLRQSPQQ